jgi:YHS domain-containing protein
MNRPSITSAVLSLAMTAAMPVFAEDEHNVSAGITTAGVPLGLHGADPVALATIHDVAEGSSTYTVVVDDVAYYLASPEAAERFEAEPEKYLPQYGGFCAYAVALGRKFDGDPRYADIVDGKLYLFVNEEIYHKYKADQENILRKAEQTWPSIRSKSVSEL